MCATAVSDIRVPHFIGGQWTNSTSSNWQEVINPATGASLGKVPLAEAAEVNSAIEAAAAAFPEWRRTPPEDRIQPLFKLKMLLEQHIDELARLITIENGKTLTEAKAELRRAIENVEVACGIPMMMQGYNLEDVARGIDETMIRQPMGVVAAITAFNFPAMIPFWFLPYAIATGNTFVLKGSERVPLTMKRAFELFEQIGLPKGGVNMAIGDAQKTFRDSIADAASKLRVGNGLEEGTQMGPVITSQSKTRVEKLIGEGEKQGAKILVDGRNAKISGGENGNFVKPTILDGVSVESELAHTEIFGPVLSLVHAKDLDEAMSFLNKNPFGNQASLFTSSGAAARRFRYEAPAGNIGINIGVAAPMAYFPFSGWKDSFFGDMNGQGRDSVEFYTEKKVVVERWAKEHSRKF